jgi:hypothetical protein
VSLVDAKSFNYLGDRITGGRATVTTQVTTKRGSTINVAYALERDADYPWRVQDVLVEGMSLLENYRTQFTVDHHAPRPTRRSSSVSAVGSRSRDEPNAVTSHASASSQ